MAEVVLTAFFLYIILGATDTRAPKGFTPLIHLVNNPVSTTVGALIPGATSARLFGKDRAGVPLEEATRGDAARGARGRSALFGPDDPCHSP